MKNKKDNRAAIFFISTSLICLFILIITWAIFTDVIKTKAEKQRQLEEYNYQVQQYRNNSKTGDPLITPALK